MSNYSLQEGINRILQDKPEWRSHLEEMVVWEEKHRPGSNGFPGWECAEVHTAPTIVSSLIARGVIDQVSKSRTYTFYRLSSLADTKEALANAEWQAGPERAPLDADGLFSLVIGHERVKALLRLALKAERPIHVILTGPPGTAKTLIISDIGRLPGAEFYAGSNTTRSGLVGLLIEKRPRILVIDELDKMDARDTTPLLSLTETGTVTRLMHGVQDRVNMETWLFAAANDIAKISPPLFSRMAKLYIPAYTPAQFIEVAREVLIQREGQGPEMALLIAREVGTHSVDIRDAVRVSRMAGTNPLQVMEVVKTLWGQGGR